MSIAVWNGGRYSHIFNYSGGAEESDARWQDIEIVIETHEYLIKIYFHILLELNLICINFLKNISLTSAISIIFWNISKRKENNYSSDSL